MASRQALAGASAGPTLKHVVFVASTVLRVAADSARLGGRELERATSSLLAAVMGRALSGPLVEAVARDIVRYAVVERVVDTVLEGDAVDRAVARILDGPEFERAVGRLLESEDLWLLVDEVARSPAVTAAITQQSLGFADQVAGGVRTRSRNADAWLERTARRALRRPPAEPDRS